VKHALAIVAAANMLALVSGPGDRPVRRRVVTAGVVAVATLAYLVSPEPPAGAAIGHPEVFGTTWGVRLHWALFLGYITWYLTAMVAVGVRYRRDAAVPELRTGMLLLAVGSAVGSAYVVEKVLVLAAWDPADAARVLPLDAAAQDAVLAVSLSLTAVGTAWEAISARRRQVAATWRLARSLRATAPLWRALTAAEPGVVLPTGPPGWGVLRPSGLARELRLRRVRRLTEIRDGVRGLGRYAGDDVGAATARAARAHGISGTAAAAAAEAAWLTVALRAKAAGRAPGAGTASGQGHGGGELGTEAAWLEQVTRAFADDRLMARLTAGLDEARAADAPEGAPR
jgi:hypothetical protein